MVKVDTQKQKFIIVPYILLIAMSVHTVFEGLALGLMEDFKPFMNLLISILIHKFAEAMSISVSM
jgi:solute carrier family 39 (zinc transporter), member 1/2/3